MNEAILARDEERKMVADLEALGLTKIERLTAQLHHSVERDGEMVPVPEDHAGLVVKWSDAKNGIVILETVQDGDSAQDVLDRMIAKHRERKASVQTSRRVEAHTSRT